MAVAKCKLKEFQKGVPRSAVPLCGFLIPQRGTAQRGTPLWISLSLCFGILRFREVLRGPGRAARHPFLESVGHETLLVRI